MLIGTATCNDMVYAPTTLWPPNHKLQTITISPTDTDNDADIFMITVNSITSNQTEHVGAGCGQWTKGKDQILLVSETPHGSDAGGTAVTSVKVRVEFAKENASQAYYVNILSAESNDHGFFFTTDLFPTVPHSKGH